MVGNKGTLVISLDFELMWGMIDIATADDYGISNVANVWQAIHRMLDLFEQHAIHATFATVGFISYPDKQALLNDCPEVKPSYINSKVSPYANNYIERIAAQHQPLYFAPDLIRDIAAAKGMEIGSHTFCHYYCTEPGQTVDEFREDLRKWMLRAKDCNIQLKSVVFPRHQIPQEYLDVCVEENLKVYRGNARRFFDFSKTGLADLLQRVGRLADCYINLSGFNTYSAESRIEANGMINVAASRFLRPYSKKLSFLDPIRLRRIKKEITYAARHGEMYHLWWHPHNFGSCMDENFSILQQILKHFDYCRDRYGMTSMNMGEYAGFVAGKRGLCEK